MSTRKQPRIFLRITPKRIASFLSVPTETAPPVSDSQRPPSPTGDASGGMAATSAEIAQERADQLHQQQQDSRFRDRKKPPQKQYRSKRTLRSLQNHHAARPTPFSDTPPTAGKSDHGGAQVVTPQVNARKSSTEKQADRHDEGVIQSRKRTRNDISANPEPSEEPPLKARRVGRKSASANGDAPKVQEDCTEKKSNNNTRSLRSQDPKKIIDLLALFLPEEAPAYIGKDEPIYIVEDEPKETRAAKRAVLTVSKSSTEKSSSKTNDNLGENQDSSNTYPPIPPARSAPIIPFDFSPFEKKASRIKEDPLTDAIFIQNHKKPATKEKRWRNVENERTQQLYSKLKDDLERLKGPDWMKLLKVSRSDDVDAQNKRHHLIRSIEKELAKQKRFTEEIRRQKRAKVERTMSPEGGSKSVSSDGRRSESSGRDHGPEENSSSRAANKGKSKKNIPVAPEPEKPFLSFFTKEHLRNAALKNWRKSARNAMAFGEPIPSIPSLDFELPPALLEEGMKARGR